MIRKLQLLQIVIALISVFGDNDFLPMSPYPSDFFTREFKNNRPIIGILTQGLDGAENPLKDFKYLEDKAYVGSSYVKFLEQAGARVVPIIEDIKDEELEKLLNKLNGVLLPGNDNDSGDGGYFQKVKIITEYSKTQTLRKKKFPILGIGRGAQRLLMAVSKKDSFEAGDALNFTAPLLWRPDDVKASRIFGKVAPRGIVNVLGQKPIASFFATFLLPVANHFNDTRLTTKIRALSWNVDRNGTKFVSTFESKKHPWYGMLWHPEKAQFEFNPTLAVDHTVHSIFASQYIANFFVSEARMNTNKFKGRKDENSHIIAKDCTYFVGNVTGSEYDQIYAYEMKDIKSDEDEK